MSFRSPSNHLAFSDPVQKLKFCLVCEEQIGLLLTIRVLLYTASEVARETEADNIRKRAVILSSSTEQVPAVKTRHSIVVAN
jgi:hypothetical protein